MLNGRVDHQLDEKKRMRIPVQYKNAFPKGEQLFFVEYAPDCISIMPQSVKDRRLGVYMDVDPGDPEFMDAMRYIYAGVVPIECDTQGRVTIPRSIRERMHLDKEIVTVGIADYIEVWDRATYEAKHANFSIKDANKIFYAKLRAQREARPDPDNA